jgi:hypothetical protein
MSTGGVLREGCVFAARNFGRLVAITIWPAIAGTLLGAAWSKGLDAIAPFPYPGNDASELRKLLWPLLDVMVPFHLWLAGDLTAAVAASLYSLRCWPGRTDRNSSIFTIYGDLRRMWRSVGLLALAVPLPAWAYFGGSIVLMFALPRLPWQPNPVAFEILLVYLAFLVFQGLPAAILSWRWLKRVLTPVALADRREDLSSAARSSESLTRGRIAESLGVLAPLLIGYVLIPTGLQYFAAGLLEIAGVPESEVPRHLVTYPVGIVASLVYVPFGVGVLTAWYLHLKGTRMSVG